MVRLTPFVGGKGGKTRSLPHPLRGSPLAEGAFRGSNSGKVATKVPPLSQPAADSSPLGEPRGVEDVAPYK